MKLETVVELWRETLAPEAALAASNLAAKVAHDSWPKVAKDFQLAWMERAIAPSVTDIVELIRVSDFKKATADHLLARFVAMENWEPHPIATRWLVDVFARQTRAPLMAGQKCFRRVFNLLIGHIDKPGAELLESWIGTHERRIAASKYGADFFDDGIKRVLAKSADRLAAARELTSAELAKLQKAELLVEPKPAPNQITVDELLAAVYQAPEDDGPRLVLADVLQQQGDPRGEFITLDMLPELTTEQRKRRSALLKEHGKAWFPEALDRIVKRDVDYERGFIARGTLLTVDRTPVELSTLREIDVDAGVPLLDHEVFRGVESWRGIVLPRHDHKHLHRWREHTSLPRVRRLGVTGAWERIVELIRPAAWPNVTEFGIDVSMYENLPMLMDQLVKLVAEHLPNVTHVHVRPFARFDRDGNTDEICVPYEIASQLDSTQDHPVVLERNQRWGGWLVARGVPIVVEDKRWIETMRRIAPNVSVRVGKRRAWHSLRQPP